MAIYNQLFQPILFQKQQLLSLPKKNLMKPSAHSSVYSKNILHSSCSLLQFKVWLVSQGYNLCKKQSKKQTKIPENILFVFTLKYFSICIYYMQIAHYWQHFWQYFYFGERQQTSKLKCKLNLGMLVFKYLNGLFGNVNNVQLRKLTDQQFKNPSVLQSHISTGKKLRIYPHFNSTQCICKIVIRKYRFKTTAVGTAGKCHV